MELNPNDVFSGNELSGDEETLPDGADYSQRNLDTSLPLPPPPRMDGDSFDSLGEEEDSEGSEWVNSSDDEQQVTSMLLGGAQTSSQKQSFKFNAEKQYDWIPNDDPFSRASTSYSSPPPEGHTGFAYNKAAPPMPSSASYNTLPDYSVATDYTTGASSGFGGGMSTGSTAGMGAGWEAPPPVTADYAGPVHSTNDEAYYAHNPFTWTPFGPPKYGKGDPLALRVWNSLQWVFFLSVHAVRLPSDVPFGANFGGVNLYGIALWGIPTCYLMEELYCNLAITLMTVNKKALGAAAAADLSSFTLAVYLGFWLFLGVVTLCRGMAGRRRVNGEYPLYNLRVISLLCTTSIPAAVGGYLWQQQLRKDYALLPKEVFAVHTWPNPKQPSSIVLSAAPFAWPLILTSLVVLFRAVFPKSLRKAKRPAASY